MTTKVCILGATGSIGESTLKLLNSSVYSLIGFSFNKNLERALEVIRDYKPLYVACTDGKTLIQLKGRNLPVELFSDNLELIDKCLGESTEKFVNAIVGTAGLRPTMYLLEKGRTVLLANKESLVVAGHLLKEVMKKTGGKIIPIDSEHASLYQLLDKQDRKEIASVSITASMGSLFNYPGNLDEVAACDVLKHPTWKMGAKITVDSATLMNKAFEVVEAIHLFDLEVEQVKVLGHPQSIIHAAITFNDGATFLHVGVNEMTLPIWYALNCPNHLRHNVLEPFDFIKHNNLTFVEVDFNKYPAIPMVLDAYKRGGFYPVVINAINEECVRLFLSGIIKFTDILKIVSKYSEKTLEYCRGLEYNINNIEKIDQLIKSEVKKWIL